MKAKYQYILNDIQQQIESRALPPGTMLPTENQYMECYSVSRTTVQRAMNILVTKGLVQRIAGKGSFVLENHGPEAVVPKEQIPLEKKQFTMILPYRSNITIQYFIGAQQAVEAKGHTIDVRFREAGYESEGSALQAVIDSGADGVLIYPNEEVSPNEYSHMLGAVPIPVVTLDKRVQWPGLSGVGSDNYLGGKLIAQRFAQLGHTSCGFMSMSRNCCHTIYDRFFGYKITLEQLGIPMQRSHIFFREPSAQISAELRTQQYLQKHIQNLPTAIFCSTDEMASDFYAASAKLGIQIPGQVSVVGYDDLEFSRFLLPPLSTVRQSYEEIGRAAGRMLCAVAAKQTPSISYMQLPVTLIERGSLTSNTTKN